MSALLACHGSKVAGYGEQNSACRPGSADEHQGVPRALLYLHCLYVKMSLIYGSLSEAI